MPTRDRKGLESKFQTIAECFNSTSGRNAYNCSPVSIRYTPGLSRSGRIICAIFALMMSFGITVQAETPSHIRRHGFENLPMICALDGPRLQAALKTHEIASNDFHSGQRCERLIFESPEASNDVERLVLPLPRARVLSELKASLWVRSNCPNLRISIRIRFPHQIDPRTGQPLAIELNGDSYTTLGEWQQLNCQTTDEALKSRLLRLRNQLSDGINPLQLNERETYVDQLIISLQIPRGASVVQFDDLELGPIVEPQTVVPEPIQQSQPSKLSIVDDRIRKNGEPFFPIFTLYHGESLDLITRMGVNMLWIRNYEDRPLLAALSSLDIGGIASPPQPSPEDAILKSSGLMTIPEWTSPIWAWMLGIKIPAEDRKYINGWADQVRDADRQIRRPILADVASDERQFHRHIDFLASSRFAIHTDVSSPDHFVELRGRRDHALPGKPMFTFLQTEASGPILDYFAPRGIIPIVEPEQILHQGYEAIAAGYKGVGFWKQIPFNNDTPGLDERMDAIRIFSIHCRTLEPFLATGRIIDDISVQVGSHQGDSKLSSPLSSRWDRAVTPTGQVVKAKGPEAEIRATVFQTEKGLLILLVWHEPGSQCVPGPQTAQHVRVLIRGIDVADAWEVTPTGVGQSNLDMDRVSGGTEITLREFDQVAAVIVPTKPSEGEALRNFARQSRKSAAEAFINLANAKYKRVRSVTEELNQAGAPSLVGVDVALSRAAASLDQANLEYQADRADDARIHSQRAMQQLRMVQRAHWEAAVDPMTSATSALEATSFQTLPEYWRLLAVLGRQSGLGPNLLPSGEFDDEQQLISPSAENRTGWSEGSTSSQWTSLRLERGGTSTSSYLSMIVKPNAPHGESAILASPKIDVAPGDLVVITGDVNIPYPLHGPGHQFAIFDTLTGRDGACIYKEKTEGWKPFRIIRKVPTAGALRLRFELAGPGIAQLDRIRVHVIKAQ